MAFTFDLTMTGLNVLSIKKQANAETFELLMVDATTSSGNCKKHQPYLSYRPEDLFSNAPPTDDLWPDSQGHQSAVRTLANKDVKFTITANSGPAPSTPLKYESDPNPGPKPISGGERYRDWVPAIDRLALTPSMLKSGVLGGGIVPGAVISRVKLDSCGRLESRNIARLKGSNVAALWSFKDSTGNVPDPMKSQSIAGSIHWIVENVVAVTISGAGSDITLAHESGTVFAGITNLPPKAVSADPVNNGLTHFHCFYKLASTSPGARIPYAEANLQTGGSVICPNLRVEWS